MSVYPAKCQQCGIDTYIEYYTAVPNKGKKPRIVTAWICGDTCAVAFFEKKLEAATA